MEAILLDGVGGQQVVQLLAGNGSGVLLNHLSPVNIGADLLALVAPGVSRTVEHVGAVSLAQLTLVQLLAQLDVVLALVGDVGLAAHQSVVLLIGAGLGGVLGLVTHGHIADLDALITSERHHVGLQGVQHQLSHLGTSQSGLGVGVDVVKQVDVRGLADGSHLPVSAEVLLVLEVTQSLHEHQAGLSSGHLLVAAIQAVADAGNHALSGASGHIGSGPVGHVSKGMGTTIIIVVQVQQVSHDNGHLVTGDASIRIEIPVFLTGHDTHSLQDFDGFLMNIRVIDVLIARSAAAHNHHTQNQGRGQEQAESTLQVSHWNSSFFIQKEVFSPKNWRKSELFCQLRKSITILTFKK